MEKPFHIQQHQCFECGKSVHGRSDKKFCSNSCRSSYHNGQYGITTAATRRIINILQRNRRILYSFVNNDQTQQKVQREALLEMGFVFSYMTHLTVIEGVTIRYCFDMCWYADTDTTVFVSRTPL